MPAGQPIPVVCALIEREGLVLIAQRPAHKHLGLLWEFPGGKVEPGESPAHALKREIREELGCEIDLVHMLPIQPFDYETVVITMTPLVAQLSLNSPPPFPREHLAISWESPASLATHTLAPADLPVLRNYLDWLTSGRTTRSDGVGS
ncbi:MAG: (deoxy)nucleoside triphosphate pyrophosphohydrolase [Opitutaceae bacterium]|nr:(deoxy)nucleoside triphosphate pyrophosphohydrolase [Opitutaceae bacterium]